MTRLLADFGGGDCSLSMTVRRWSGAFAARLRWDFQAEIFNLAAWLRDRD